MISIQKNQNESKIIKEGYFFAIAFWVIGQSENIDIRWKFSQYWFQKYKEEINQTSSLAVRGGQSWNFNHVF